MSLSHLSPAAKDVLSERRRQITQEGWTPAHDDAHEDWQLSAAAACYALAAGDRNHAAPSFWPWDEAWWKCTPGNPRRMLVKAGALILAEIERLDRAESRVAP